MTTRRVAGAKRAGGAAAVLLAGMLGAVPARGQSDTPEVAGGGNGAATSIPCTEINNRAMEATLVIRQHASALSVGFEPEARPQAIQMLAWLDQWAGRLRGFVELGEYSMCLDDGDTETYRRALVSAQRIANQARDDLLRPVRAPQQQQQQQQQQRPRRP
ncbi:hypothetical protein [Neoroseomonas soli]|uniref:UrcA family protein n=1 Tax=Neoroseomonas soli TaxID=1081025 RepID=A0A9X9WZL4_9PROT|nr:hypothetical protein [Neoroseomonas soli]MBR0672593.1 hypothetical protein [Neoroseomonas soli]